jgi:transposase-like protein
MVRCYKCGSTNCVKSGFMQGLQRYKCKDCAENFVDKPRRGYGQVAVSMAVWLHLSGVPKRQIARLFGVTPAAVSKWIRDFKPPKER